MRVTIKEIARELGISHSTVSRVLNDKQSNLVSAKTSELILETAKRLGYRPNRHARALKGETSKLLGVLLPDDSSYSFHEMLACLRRIVEPDGYELLTFTCPVDQVQATWDRLRHWDLDGAFLIGASLYAKELRGMLLADCGYVPPVVSLGGDRPAAQDYVAVDYRPALKSLLNVLKEQGRKRVAYVGTRDSMQSEEPRFSVYREFSGEAGKAEQRLVLPESRDLCASAYQAVSQAAKAMMAGGKCLPDAMFCDNDDVALGVYRALYENGVTVPDQVALAGCDDMPFVRYLATPLTSIRVPVQTVCELAWEVLQARMADPARTPMQKMVEAELVLRESTQSRAKSEETLEKDFHAKRTIRSEPAGCNA